MIDAMRSEFSEKFLVPRYGRVLAECYAQMLDTQNTVYIIQDCWEAWQACAARMVPEGYVVVPVEPTSDMVCSAINAGSIDADDVLWVWGEMLAAATEGKK